MLTVVYVVIEVISALALVFLILMHSGKGGGLSDMFGGSIGSAAQGSTVVDAALAGGFADQSHMTRSFVAKFGYTPGAYARALR